MGGLSVVEEAATATGKRENGDPWGNAYCQSQHRRSKSASDRNAAVSRGGGSHCMQQKQNETYGLQQSTSVSRGQDPADDNANYNNKNTSSKHRASLEKDIEQLQWRLQQEKSMRIVLEKAIGRVSSTLSPGHRHLATQTKELVSEIELLEEEVANREQHVLSLYRNIFDKCVTPSEQNSVVASPAHAKHGSRKHPSIISSAFCSSKKFPLQPLQALVPIDDSRKRLSKSNHTAVPNDKGNNTDFEKAGFDSAKVREKVPAEEKVPGPLTLNDHLSQCPCKLSEEMVRCMASIYCLLDTAASVNTEKNRSSLVSRSSTEVTQPQCGIGQDQHRPYKSMIEISCISTDKSQFSHASYAINNYRFLVEQLERVKVSQMENNAQTAFWINVYNALVMHAYLAYGIPNYLRRLALFQKAAYNIGGQVISANAIEHSIFCLRTPPIGRWLETVLFTALRKKSGEERLISSKLGLPSSEPLVCFALCTGAFSDPVLKFYTASNVREELEAAKREFLQANVVVKKSRKVFLSKVLERYAREASLSPDHLLTWVSENVDKKLHESIQKRIDSKSSKRASQIIEWLPYSSRFRYVFSKDLTEKAC